MAHRPYPVPARALRQILRRYRNELPVALLAYARRPADGGHVPYYLLSTRRAAGSR